MAWIFKIGGIIVLLLWIGRIVNGVRYYDDDLTGAVSTILDNAYEIQSIRPVDDVSATLDVNISLNLVAINDFDEANGFIEVSGYLTLDWLATAYDDTLTFNGAENLLNNKVWKPPIILVNSIKHFDEIGSDSNIKIQYHFVTRKSTWKPWLITRVACSPDVTYYPFDKQTCVLKFAAWGYKSTELKLSPTTPWTFNFFEENGEWQIDQTSVNSTNVDNISVAEFKIKLSRRPIYYIINLMAPLITLGILNAMTFLLPAASGERIGFSVTCFLAYVVLLNMIMDFLPTSATPLSYLSYYTFIMMLFSAAICLASILTIRIHLKDENDKVPSCLQGFFRCCLCKCCSVTRVTAPVDDCVTAWDGKDEEVASNHSNDEELPVSWKDIGSFVDKVLFIGFLGGISFYSVAYLLPLFLLSN